MNPGWLLPLLVWGSAPKKVKVAVPDMHLAGSVNAETAGLLSDVLAKSMSDVRPDRMQVIPSTMMQSILGLEREKQLLGCKEDNSCLVEVGNALGADELVSCTLGKLGSTFLMSCTLIDLGKSAADVTVQDSFTGPDDQLIGSARKVGAQLGAAVNNRVRALDAAQGAQAAKPPPAAPPAVAAAAKAAATPPAPLVTFVGRVNGFPYDDYPPPRLDPDAAARYLRAHP